MLSDKGRFGLAFIIIAILAFFVFPEVAFAVHGHYLVVDSGNHRVIELDADKNIVWQYGMTEKPGSGPNQLNFPLDATRLKGGNTLITEADNQRVIEVSPEKKIVWQFDADDAQGNFYPVAAYRCSNGNTLITDWINHRVIEVDPEKEIVWQYGPANGGVPGSETNELNYPEDAVELRNGDVLITDTGNERVIAVDREKNIVWQYGITGAAGVGDEQLNHPLDAVELANGNILITDEVNCRVIEVNDQSEIVWQYGGSKGCAEGQLNVPQAAAELPNGNILITDQLNHRVIAVSRDGKIIWQYGDNYNPGSEPGELLFPMDAEGALVPLRDPSLPFPTPPKKDPNDLSFLWIIGGWAAFCFTVVFGLYYLTSKERGA